MRLGCPPLPPLELFCLALSGQLLLTLCEVPSAVGRFELARLRITPPSISIANASCRLATWVPLLQRFSGSYLCTFLTFFKGLPCATKFPPGYQQHPIPVSLTGGCGSGRYFSVVTSSAFMRQPLTVGAHNVLLCIVFFPRFRLLNP